ncbi:MAG: TonB-dependent receptor plug domain-containing protein, partial [Flavitalea sp.]
MRFIQRRSPSAICALVFILSIINVSQLFSQEKQSLVKGFVANNKSEPISGVSVIVRNNKTNFTSGTSTDSAGLFAFTRMPSGGPYTFTFTAVGFEEQTLSGYNIKDDVTLSLVVKMKSTSEALNEVVVVGYGTQRRKDLTGSVASVSADKIKDLAATRVDQALLGKVAGVQVKPSSGEPGSPPQIRIRGVGSISAGGDPLYVVDGVPMASIQALNPNDIENIDVLKDASATAIYGSRGSNGVVIINTKRGKTGKTIFGFDTYFGFQKIAKIPVYQTALEEAQHYYEGIKNRNIDEGNSITGYPTTWKQAVPITIMEVLEGKTPTQPGTTLDFQNHLDRVLQTGPMQQYQLTARGGTENVKYALGGEYL